MPVVIQTGFFKGTRISGRSKYASQLETIVQRLEESEGALEKHAQATVFAAAALLQQLPRRVLSRDSIIQPMVNGLSAPVSHDASRMLDLEGMLKQDEKILNALYRAVIAQFSYLTNDSAKDVALHLRMAMAERQDNPLRALNFNHCKKVMRGDIKKQVAAHTRFMSKLMSIAAITMYTLSIASLFLPVAPLAMWSIYVACYAIGAVIQGINKSYCANVPSRIQAEVSKRLGPDLDALQTLLGSVVSQAENVVGLKAFEAEANAPSTVVAAPVIAEPIDIPTARFV